MKYILFCGIGAAFLAFKSLKIKNTGKNELWLPINPKKLKKFWKFEFFPYPAFVLAFKIFLAFFQFFWPFDTPCSCNYLKLSQFCWPNTWNSCCYFWSEKNHCVISFSLFVRHKRPWIPTFLKWMIQRIFLLFIVPWTAIIFNNFSTLDGY